MSAVPLACPCCGEGKILDGSFFCGICEETMPQPAKSIPSAADDFYLHVNQKWLTDPKNTIPKDYSSWGGFLKLYDEGLTAQIDIVKALKDKDKSDRDIEEEKIYSIWKAATDLFESWSKNEGSYEPINKELGILDETITSNNTSTLAESLAKYFFHCQNIGIGNVLSFDKGSDLQNSNNVVLDLSTGGLSLPSREYYIQEKYEDKLKLFEKHLEKTKTLLIEGNISRLDDNFVENVMNFEKKIAAYSMKPDQSREYDSYYTNTNLDDTYKNINDLVSLARKSENYEENDKDFKITDSQLISTLSVFFESLYSIFNLRQIMEGNLQKNFKDDDDKKPNVYHLTAFDGDAIRRCCALILDPSNYSEYHSYMQYQIIRTMSDFCTEALDEEFFDFYERQLKGQQQQKPLDKRCINIVNGYAGEMLGKLFVKKYFPEKSKQDMDNLVGTVKTVMNDSINNLDWMTQPTKEKALEKLSTFRTKIGYPSEWKDYTKFCPTSSDSLYDIYCKYKVWSMQINFYDKLNTVLDREEWRMTPQTVNAYFMPTQNEIVFPAAILQPPFFNQNFETIDFDIQDELALAALDYPPNINMNNNMTVKDLFVVAANYGGIGAVIAHEITHGYDDKGRKFNGDGNLVDWWLPDDANLFTQKTEIMALSVEKYVYVDDEVAPAKDDVSEKREEKKEYKMNAKLTMGENLADIGGISLSLQALKFKLNEDEVSPNLGRACIRVFFKSWANVWKQNVRKERRIMLLDVDPHAPNDFRGNLVNHSKDFYEAFDIKMDAKMYLEEDKRVVMY